MNTQIECNVHRTENRLSKIGLANFTQLFLVHSSSILNTDFANVAYALLSFSFLSFNISLSSFAFSLNFLTWNAVTCLLRKDCISSVRPVTQNVHTFARTDVQDLAERLACGSGSEDSARAVLWRPLFVRPSLLTCAQIYTHTLIRSDKVCTTSYKNPHTKKTHTFSPPGELHLDTQ